MSPRSSSRIINLALVGLSVAGCHGAQRSDDPGARPVVPAALPPPGDPSAAAGPQPTATLHKLTIVEFNNSLRDLLGDDVPLTDALEPDHESDGLRSIAASLSSLSPAGIVRYETATGAATLHAFADDRRAARVVACLPTGPDDTDCLTRAINTFGRRAFRRPLTAADTARYLDVATTIAAEPGGTALAGLRHAVWAILQSPSFLYRVELGAPSAADGGRLKYTDFEMSSRLAATLWATVPDEALLDAAASGQLSSADGVRRQAQRLLAAPQARRAFSAFVDDVYDLKRLNEAVKDAAMFPTWTPTLRESMRHELLMRVEDAAFSPVDFLSVFDQETTFVDNELARHYGLPQATTDGFRRVQLPEGGPRRGLLGSGALLAAYGLPQRTSPTARGKFVVEALLCREIPAPPPGVDTSLAEPAPGTSLRQNLEAHRRNPACATCHDLMDPVGVALESFDTVGALRTTDGTSVIDASGDLDGVPFQDAAQLGALLRKQPDAAGCFVRKLYSHAQGRSPLPVDEASLKDLTTRFANDNHRADRLIVDLVASDAFRFVEVGAR